MRENRFSDLNTAHIVFGHIADNLTCEYLLAVGKQYASSERVDIVDNISSILFHFLGLVIKTIIPIQYTGFAVDRFAVIDFKFDLGAWRFVGRQHDLFQIKITVGAAEVFDLKALDLYFLDKTFIECFQRVEHINKVVLFFVGGRVVQRKQRIKVFQRLLCNSSAHLLRFIKNQNRAVCLDDVNRST